MGTRNHPDLPFHAYFITTTTHDRLPVFADPAAATLFTEDLFALRKELIFLLPAYVVMPDHIHLIIVPSLRAQLAKIMQHIKGRFARRYHERHGGEGKLWQPRYYERVISDEAALLRSVDYIEANPQEAGLASEAESYAYSSASRPTGDLEGYLSGDAMAGWPE